MVGRTHNVTVSVTKLDGLVIGLVERGPACASPGVT